MQEFGEKLGTSNLESQVKLCKINIKLTESYLHEANEIKNKKSKLYVTLGISSGISLVLLLI